MLQRLLPKDDIIYISIRDQQFVIDQKRYDTLQAIIQDLHPVRKYFADGKLQCYARDGRVGYNNQLCAICRLRPHCQLRLRLALRLYRGRQFEPAILEVTRGSFDALQEVIDDVGEANLNATLLNLKVVILDNDRTGVEFHAAY